MKIKSSSKIPIPKPKPKSKYPKAKKIKGAGKKFDIFKTLFESDAGADSSHQSTKMLYEEIQKLSKPQLSLLEKKIQRVQSSLMNRKARKRYSQIREWINERLTYSQIQEDLLIKQIRKKVRRHQISYSESANQFFVEDERCSFKRLSKRHFQEEVEQINRDLESGMLLSPHRGHGASGILKRLLLRCLK